jgi:predicted heme/steroid binding protein
MPRPNKFIPRNTALNEHGCSKSPGVSMRCSIYNISLSLVKSEFSIDTLHSSGKDSSKAINAYGGFDKGSSSKTMLRER